MLYVKLDVFRSFWQLDGLFLGYFTTWKRLLWNERRCAKH